MVRTSMCLALTLLAATPASADSDTALDWYPGTITTVTHKTAVYYAGGDTFELKGIDPTRNRITYVDVCNDAAKDAESGTRSNNMRKMLTDYVGEKEVNGITAVVIEKPSAGGFGHTCLRLRYFYY